MNFNKLITALKAVAGSKKSSTQDDEDDDNKKKSTRTCKSKE